MAAWAGNLHNKMRDIRNKAYTGLWYRLLFKRIGGNCSISPPFYTNRPDCIELGERVFIGPLCRVEAHPYGRSERQGLPKLVIGNRVVLGHAVNVSCHRSLTIEDDALIAGGCYISDNNHAMDPEGEQYVDQELIFAPTRIGRGAWLGENVCVLAGSSIGERCIIGAGSVVRGIIPPYTIAVGAPARVVKRYCFETKEWIRANGTETGSGAGAGVAADAANEAAAAKS